MKIPKRDLKAWVRIDGQGIIVPSSVILARKKPTVGKWIEGNAYICCSEVITTTTATTTVVPTTTTTTTTVAPVTTTTTTTRVTTTTTTTIPATTSTTTTANTVTSYNMSNAYYGTSEEVCADVMTDITVMYSSHHVDDLTGHGLYTDIGLTIPYVETETLPVYRGLIEITGPVASYSVQFDAESNILAITQCL